MIRPATYVYVARIVEMGEKLIIDFYPLAMTFDGPSLEKLTKRLIDGAGAVFVVDIEIVVGVIALVLVTQPMSGETIATELVWWVDPNARGGRAALELLAAAETWAKLNGATRLQMIAPSDKVCRFYEKLGFDRVEVAYMRTL